MPDSVPPPLSTPSPDPGAPTTPAGPPPAIRLSPGLRPADPEQRHRPDLASAARVFAVMTATLLVAALLNASTMRERAETGPLGPGRERALAFWRPVETVSSGLGLTHPRDGLEALRSGVDPVSPGRLGSDELAAPTNVLGHEPLVPSHPPIRPELGDEPLTTTTEGGDGSPAGPSAITSLPGSATPLGLPPPVTGRTPGPTTPTPSSSSPDLRSPTTGFPLRRPTVAEPVEVLIVGDSTVEPVGNSVLRLLADTGVADASLDYRVSTGLSRPDYFDWPAHLASLRTATGPEIVVVMLGANDAQAFVVDGTVLEFGTDEWIEAYRGRVADLFDQLTQGDRWVIWIGQPVMRSADFDARLDTITDLVEAEAAVRPTVRFIDTREALSDSGAYAPYLVDDDGNRQLVRQNDGIHLTPGGGDHLAPLVVNEINTIAPLY